MLHFACDLRCGLHHGQCRCPWVALTLFLLEMMIFELCGTICMGLCCGLHHGQCSCQCVQFAFFVLEMIILKLCVTICMGLCCGLHTGPCRWPIGWVGSVCPWIDSHEALCCTLHGICVVDCIMGHADAHGWH